MARIWLTVGFSILGLAGGVAMYFSVNPATGDDTQWLLAIMLGVIGGMALTSAANTIWRMWNSTNDAERRS